MAVDIWYLLGGALGALLLTLLLSRLLHLLFWKWNGGTAKIVAANILPFFFCLAMLSNNQITGNPIDFRYLPLYLAAQTIWFILDFRRLRRKTAAEKRKAVTVFE